MLPPDDELEALLDRIPVLQGLQRTVVELHGGLTNHNLHVTTPERDLVVRLFRGDPDLLGIDRDAEHLNTRAAAAAGVGAGVVDYLPQLGILVIDYVNGTTYTNDSFSGPGVIARVAAACRQLHQGPRFTNEFDMFVRQPRYLRTVREQGYALFEGYADFTDAFDRVRRALAVRAGPTVPCNNDLLAGNFVDDGTKIWLIDYEYSGNNDACFELGNTATECELDEGQVEALTAAYFGRRTRHDLARVQLQSLASQYGWSLWGAIQSAASSIEFDFFGWGLERFEKAAATFSGPSFGRLLEEAVRDD